MVGSDTNDPKFSNLHNDIIDFVESRVKAYDTLPRILYLVYDADKEDIEHPIKGDYAIGKKSDDIIKRLKEIRDYMNSHKNLEIKDSYFNRPLTLPIENIQQVLDLYKLIADLFDKMYLNDPESLTRENLLDIIEKMKNWKYRPLSEIFYIDTEDEKRRVYKFSNNILNIVKQNIGKRIEQEKDEYNKLILECLKSLIEKDNTEKFNELYSITDYVAKCIENNGRKNIDKNYISKYILEVIYNLSVSELGDEIYNNILINNDLKSNDLKTKIKLMIEKVIEFVKTLFNEVRNNKKRTITIVGVIIVITIIIIAISKKVPIIGKFFSKIYGGIKWFAKLPLRLFNKLFKKSPTQVSALFEQYMTDERVRRQINNRYVRMNRYFFTTRNYMKKF